MAKPFNSVAQFGARLKQIADALGIPVSQLYGERDPLPVGDALELLRLYATIDDVQGRQRLMNAARQEAARCQAPKGSASSAD